MFAREQLEIGAFRKADLKLDPAVYRGGVEHENPRLRACFQRDLDAPHLDLLVAGQPDLLQLSPARL